MSLSLSGLLGPLSSLQPASAPAQSPAASGEAAAPPPSSESPSHSEPGVTYVPSASQGEAVTYSPDQSNSVSSTAAAATSNEGSAQASQAATASSAVERQSITEQVAAGRSVAVEPVSANDNEGFSSPRVAELMQAFLAQYGRNDRQVLDLL